MEEGPAGSVAGQAREDGDGGGSRRIRRRAGTIGGVEEGPAGSVAGQT